MLFYLTSIDSFLQQVGIRKQLHSFKDSRLENVKKKAADVVASKGTSGNIMVDAPRNVKRVVFHRRHPKPSGIVSKKKQQKRSLLMSPANRKKVPVAKIFFNSLFFVSLLDSLSY